MSFGTCDVDLPTSFVFVAMKSKSGVTGDPPVKLTWQEQIDKNTTRAVWPDDVTIRFIEIRGKLEYGLQGKMDKMVNMTDLVATELQDYCVNELGLVLPSDPYYTAKVQENKLGTMRKTLKDLNKEFSKYFIVTCKLYVANRCLARRYQHRLCSGP